MNAKTIFYLLASVIVLSALAGAGTYSVTLSKEADTYLTSQVTASKAASTAEALTELVEEKAADEVRALTIEQRQDIINTAGRLAHWPQRYNATITALHNIETFGVACPGKAG